MIDHSQVASCECTCEACPEQYEGTLTDGTVFYFRARFGQAQLGLGATVDQAVIDTLGEGSARMRFGDNLQGMFDDDEHRNQVFATLLAQRRTTE
jgi:hypothetical protein